MRNSSILPHTALNFTVCDRALKTDTRVRAYYILLLYT